MAQLIERESKDEVLEEVRRIKASLAEAANFDIKRMLDEARQKQKEGGRQIIEPPVRES